MDEFCAHRGVSLWFGRNEENGLRCPYHGWKYDVTGQCVEVPSEPVESGFCKKIKLTSYACAELGDVIWIYMGPPAQNRRCRISNGRRLPLRTRFVSKRTQECNWLQALEGGIDSVHVSFLHRHDLRSDPLHVSQGAEFTRETDARFEVIETKGGMVIGVRRPATPGKSLLAHHAMDHAVPHHDPALRRQRAQRPRLRADRRRKLRGVVLHAPSGAGAQRARARDHAQRRRHPRQSHSRLVPPGRQ